MSEDRNTRIESAIWRWQEDVFYTGGLSARKLRWQACWRVCLMAISAGIFYYFELRSMVTVIVFFACLTTLLAAISPTRLYVSLDRGAEALMKGLALLLQWLVCPLIYFCFFAPYGLIFRRGDRHSIKRDFDRGQQSYWLPVSHKPGRKNQF